MSLISYAQNYEDIMLWRALKHIQKGFYIDVGAWSPDLDSVTKLFYMNGWCGINIEPNSEYHELLEKKRPNDINLCIALSDKPGICEMNFLSNPGLSTLDDAIAQVHTKEGMAISKHQVEVSTLSRIWEKYIAEDQVVHFLKVDVEGLEKLVLQGNDWSQRRPWIVVVEATVPMSQQESYESWEHILVSAGYVHAYSDGLNRFYVAEERSELLGSFKYPPNVFDQFIPLGQYQAVQQESRAIERAHLAETEMNRVITLRKQSEARIIELEAELQNIYNSRSWAITSPLRVISKHLRKLTGTQ